MAEEILTVREIADTLNFSQKTVYRHAVEAQILGFRIGGSWRFRSTDIDGWIADDVSKSPPAPHSDNSDRRETCSRE
ncbi:MAG: helix-turn-helix domain-containing protein [Gammaproteobacteria bacterium]|nr:helix-turn-helix domain-containing protein [Gammaproteobacteria bacterium]